MKKVALAFCIGAMVCLISCTRVIRPLEIVRVSAETELADLNTDFYAESVAISPDVRHIAYVEDVYSGLRVVLDSIPEETFDDISVPLVFSPANDHVSYFGYHDGYSGGIFGLFATDPYWEVVVNDSAYGKYPDLIDNSLVFSPDGKHVAYGVLLSQYLSYIYYDHERLPSRIPVKELSGDSIWVADIFPPFLFSPNSKKFAYVADCSYDYYSFYTVIVNNIAGMFGNYIYPHSLVFSPNSEKLAYIVQGLSSEKVVVNEKELAHYASIAESSICFSPDSEHLAYAALQNGKWYVICDEIKSKPFDEIGHIVFSPDSKHLAYTAKENGDWMVIKDKKEISRHSAILENTLAFSPVSKHLIYAAEADSSIVIYEDSKPIAYHKALVTPPIFSSDGQFLVYTIEENKTQSVVVNGNIGKYYPAIISHNGGKIVFDNNSSIHYLAVKDDDKVYLVEEQIHY